jgi:hypothetical protein
MPKNTQLRHFYSFPDFTPATHIRGLFGDPYAVVIPLRRRSKKLLAESAAPFIARPTINRFVGLAISMSAGDASTLSSLFAASPADGALP